LVHYGQPLDAAQDIGLAYSRSQPIKAYEVICHAPHDLNARVTDRVLTVKELLTPVDRERDVGIVRCLGLNYSDHAVRL